VVVSSFWKICAFIYLVSRNEIWWLLAKLTVYVYV
jgi:hypothetical protein